ncbi:type I restriction endonuclease subunit R [Fructobacillus sp. S1-1]|uniref:Type I restriction enzyme endonuclease subunit n=1 Tax=Fructobacillus parabroussonetiae TaxID=2713174 RepID=A0ABS5QX07_9LACO|nr:type I restriction endonuclease subunit R [Fructobacillus parabroussonetiae]
MADQQRELEFEDELIAFLQQLGGTKQWEYRSDIKTNEQLWANFKQILERNNPKLDKPLSDQEFKQVQTVITNIQTPYEAGQFLYGSNGTSQIEVDLDDGTHVFLDVFDSSQIGAGNTVYQVVNQIQRPKVQAGRENRRFDTTLLINGLPIIQIEEKTNSHPSSEALNQMEKYTQEGQYSDIFSMIQILIAMTPSDIQYMAAATADKFNKAFAFRWQREKDNTRVNDWKEFTNEFLSIPMAHQMATNFMVLDGTKGREMLKVMRSYQVYATKRVLDKVERHHFGIDDPKLGYVWHTTGSGKTISSFKAAWLASRKPNVEKVVFMVDRVALTDQTTSQYTAFDPDATSDSKTSVVSDTANVSDLKKKLQSKDVKGIIVTSNQKMNRLADKYAAERDKFDKNILFVVDEAHRSTGGEGFEKARKFFKNAAWIGYTGTPMFEKNPSTQDIFGGLLHSYTIREAIADHNVLGFNVEFRTTLPEKTVKEEYLPQYYAGQHPDWDDTKIQQKINTMTAADIDQAVEPNIYDNNDKHVEEVVSEILEHWQNRSADYKYNALFTTHASGNKPSVPLAMKYYREFKRQNTEDNPKLKRKLNIAITFSLNKSNDDNMNENNEAWREAVSDYSEMFGGKFSEENEDEYTADVAAHLNRSSGDGKVLDLVIVVNRFLTGFDAPKMNTLYVDRTLAGAGLIQAYSRTNRIENNTTKPYGLIINYRWPELSKQIMNQALELYSNKNSADIDNSGDKDEGDGNGPILAKPFKEVIEDASEVVNNLRAFTQDFIDTPNSENDQEEMMKDLRRYNRLVNQLKQYPEYNYDEPEALLEKIGLNEEQERTLTGSLTTQIKEKVAKREGVEISELDLEMTHISDVKVNYDYLKDLLADLANQVHDNEHEKATKTYEDIQKQTKQLDDQKYAKQVQRTASGLRSGEMKAGDYPVKADDVEGLLKDSENVSKRGTIRQFINQWGLDAKVAEIQKVLDEHQKGSDDLNTMGQLDELRQNGQANYKELANDPEVKNLKKIKYRNAFSEAFTKFADAFVEEY